ncbi:hypothetical protein P8452_55071 [Trifolium repens]|nr:hypothetical protein P8452_55071 [Trifolium repens]
MLSSELVQGYMQFQAEAKLFDVVHHKYLIGLIGYCDDDTNMALIYEYMANGDLAKHLLDKSEHILILNQRLQIADDAAEGYFYKNFTKGEQFCGYTPQHFAMNTFPRDIFDMGEKSDLMVQEAYQSDPFDGELNWIREDIPAAIIEKSSVVMEETRNEDSDFD